MSREDNQQGETKEDEPPNLDKVPCHHSNSAASISPPRRTSTAQRWNTNEFLRNAPTQPLESPTRTNTAARTMMRQKTKGELDPCRTLSNQQTRRQAEVEQDYYNFNPWYGQAPQPLFGLSEPLAHIVRPGMRRLSSSDKRTAEKQEGAKADDLEKGQTRADRPDRTKTGTRLPSRQRTAGSHTAGSDWRPRTSRTRDGAATSSEEEGGVGPRGGFGLSPVPSESEVSLSQAGISPFDMAAMSGQSGSAGPQAEWLSSEATKTEDEGYEEGEGSWKEKEGEELTEKERRKMEQQFYDQFRNRWGRFRARYPEPLAEFLATTITIFLGMTGSISATLSQDTGFGSYETARVWGLATMVGIYLAAGISGAHLNPAISFTLFLYRGFPWRRCTIYVLAQVLGGLVGGGLAWAFYRDAIHHSDPTLSPDLTGKAFFTTPQPFVSTQTAFFSEFAATGVLACAVLALGDDQNSPPGAGMNAFVIGLLVALIEMALGHNTGPAMNPARDLGPRLVALWAGYGREVFMNGWWVYGLWTATLTGACAGATVYDTFVFVGAESPVNYLWPTKRELVGKVKNGLRGRRGSGEWTRPDEACAGKRSCEIGKD